LFSIILVFGIYEQQTWPRKAELQLDNFKGLYTYMSTPEEGMPALPFRNNARRKSTDEPWFFYEEEVDSLAVVPPVP